MFCNEAILINQGPTEGHASVLKCKRWSCDFCNPYNHSRIKRAAREGKPNTFLTLTVDSKRYETPDQAARDLKRGWFNLRRRMVNELGMQAPPFIAVFEETKKGWPHLHILMRAKFVSQSWYSTAMDELIGAKVVWVDFVRNVKKVAFYVAKYISKAPQGFKGSKRWWRSHDFEQEKEDQPLFERYSPFNVQASMSLAQWTYRQECRGYVTVEQTRYYARGVWWSGHPESPLSAPSNLMVATRFGTEEPPGGWGDD